MSSVTCLYLVLAACTRQNQTKSNQQLQFFDKNEQINDSSQNKQYESNEKDKRPIFRMVLNISHDPEFLAFHNLTKDNVLDSFRMLAKKRDFESKRIFNFNNERINSTLFLNKIFYFLSNNFLMV